MSGPTQAEKIDDGCLSAFFLRLKIKGKRRKWRTSVADNLVAKADPTQKSNTGTPGRFGEPDDPSPSAEDEKIDLPRETASLELTSHVDLWQEAFKQLDAMEKDILGKDVVKSDGAIALIDTVRARESEFKNESAKLKIGDDEILWRDCAARVVRWLTSFGDIAVTFAPNPASVVWSGLKVLLQVCI